MSKFAQYLIEISLQDHYDKYVQGKSNLTFDEYQDIANLDPTTQNDQRGKYVEWILRLINKDPVGWDEIAPKDNLKALLSKFHNNATGKDINSFKTFGSFFDFASDLEEKESKRSIKKKEKDIFDMPDDIKVIDETDEWICIETLTREGNIKGAQYKTNPQANWCTAYLNDDYHWKQYHRRGDLLQFINKKDPFEKYQIFVQDESIKESRDYHDRQSSEPYEIIKELPEFENNYGRVNEREPFKYIWDEEGGAAYLLDDNFDQEWDYLNRQPDEDEYDDYYEEASQNEEWQINHWDRFLRTFYDIYFHARNNKYSEVKSRMEHVPGYFTNPITGDESDIEPAHEAVIDFCDSIEEDWKDFLESVEDSDEAPKPEDYDDPDEYEREALEFKKTIKDEFLRDEGARVEFIQYFLNDGFSYDFSFDSDDLIGGKDNSHEQTSFNFESILNSLRGYKNELTNQ